MCQSGQDEFSFVEIWIYERILVSFEFVIRDANLADLQTVTRFNIWLAKETENITLDPNVVIKGVEQLLRDPAKGRYLVACRNQEIVGQLMHTYEWSDWRNGMIWWLQSVYVTLEYRRNGVFKSLFRYLKAEADANPEVVGLRLYVEHANEIAQQTYRDFGFLAGGYAVMEQWSYSSNQ